MVEIAQKARIPPWVSKIMHQRPRTRVNGLKKRQDFFGPIATEPGRVLPQQIALAKNLLRPRQLGQLATHLQQILAIGLGGVLAKVQLMLIAGTLQVIAQPREPWRANQAIVF